MLPELLLVLVRPLLAVPPLTLVIVLVLAVVVQRVTTRIVPVISIGHDRAGPLPAGYTCSAFPFAIFS